MRNILTGLRSIRVEWPLQLLSLQLVAIYWVTAHMTERRLNASQPVIVLFTGSLRQGDSAGQPRPIQHGVQRLSEPSPPFVTLPRHTSFCRNSPQACTVVMTVRIPDYRTCGLQAKYRLYPLLRRLLSSTTNLGPGLNTRTDPARDGGYTHGPNMVGR